MLSRIITRSIRSNTCHHLPIQRYYHHRGGGPEFHQFIQSTLLHSSQGGIPLKPNSRLPLRTILLLIASSSSLTMLFYVIVQYKKFQDEVEPDGKLRKRSIFLPLWINGNVMYRKTYNFPTGLKYMDRDYYEYTVTEMDQIKKNYFDVLQEENIKYCVLEGLSANKKIKEMFGLPLSIELNVNDAEHDSGFRMWVESKYPAVSGVEVDIFERKTDDNTKNTTFDVNWIVKPVNIGSVVNDTLTSLGLKLDRLERSDANLKTHEQGSGKVHSVKLEKEKIQLNKSRDYSIEFKGKFIVSDKTFVNLGVVSYTGTIDFDHLMINRGVRITGMDLNTNGIVYKVM